MGRIVTDGRSIAVDPACDSTVRGRRSGQHQFRKQVRIESKRTNMDLGSKWKIMAALADLELVREHFGLSEGDALRISLHLTANAIRANKAHPEVA